MRSCETCAFRDRHVARCPKCLSNLLEIASKKAKTPVGPSDRKSWTSHWVPAGVLAVDRERSGSKRPPWWTRLKGWFVS